MSMIERSIDGMAALSGQLGAILQRRLREMGGIALISLAMMAALALATWSVQDPSLSHATDAPVHNLLGMPGAVAADLMMQLLGLGSLALLLPIAVWGYRLLGHRPLSHERLRVLLWLVGAALAAAFASCLPKSLHWPLPSGLGGVIGDAVLWLPLALLHVRLAGAIRFAAAILFGVAALLAFAGAAGMLWRDAADDFDDEAPAEDDDSGWISLGRLAHYLLSFRARLARLFGRRRRTPLGLREEGGAPRRRIEPRLGGRGGAQCRRRRARGGRNRAAAAPAARAATAPLGRRLRSSRARIAHAAEQDRPRHRQLGNIAGKRHRARRRARAISACAARSSMRGPVRW